MAYYNKSDQNAESHYDIYGFDTPGSKYDFFWQIYLKEMIEMIPMRPRYPSNKITFTIANITKGKTIRYININLNPYEKLDVDALDLKFECLLGGFKKEHPPILFTSSSFDLREPLT